MGNTLSCCVSPGTSPTLSGRSGLRGQELRHQERTDAYRVEAELREAESSPGTNLQHISDREAPEGKSRYTVRGGGRGGCVEPVRPTRERHGARPEQARGRKRC